MKNFEIVVKTLFGFEEILATEIQNIGGTDIEILTRAVKFTGTQEHLYKANYLFRTAIKVLKPIARFSVENETDLYKKIREISWTDYMTVDQTFAIDGMTSGETFKHSKFVALKCKDAVVDQFRDKYGVRPSVNIDNPDLRINIHISEKMCTVSLDSSGSSLGKRGYKMQQTLAPLSEVLAAGILMLSGWDGKNCFVDAMCGSGTFAIEAAIIAANIPAGNWRNFTFEKWKDFDAVLWTKIKNEAQKSVVPVSAEIWGFDIDKRAIEISRSNTIRAGLDKYIRFKLVDFLKSEKPSEKGILFMNPPYGERLEEKERMLLFYKEIGTRLKHFYNGFDAWVLSGNYEALKHFGLHPSKKIKLYNGPIECRLHKYEIYSGSKKSN